MITYKKGDLLKATEDAIGHGCNCKSTMGSGVAKVIRAQWPQAYQADVDFGVSGKHRIGSFSSTEGDGKRIYNIYTQVDYLPRGIDHFQYEGFSTGIVSVMKDMKQRGLKTLALPKIGSGLAGGRWDFIEKTIREASDEQSIPVTIYEI